MKLKTILQKSLNKKNISREESAFLLSLSGADMFDFFGVANRLREEYSGKYIKLCAIINAKSGGCEEDCAFCAQSSHYKTKVHVYPLVSNAKIVESAKKAKSDGAIEFSIVTSGYSIETTEEIKKLAFAISEMKKATGMGACASLGILSETTLKKLKEAGLNHYHHNLETARSYFPEICTTHDYDDDIKAVLNAKKCGLKVCCGGIFGLGESIEQRVELLMTLKELDVDSVPINFLNPIPGTPLEGKNHLTPMECLKIIALARVLLPDKDIVICGGREVNLRDLQPMMFFAGANGTMTGDYLTTRGRPSEEDLRMIESCGLEPAPMTGD